jgi:S-(hydroxymethyl)glutathione dehydrogenase/alcohol dehydrogenase
MDAAVLSSIPGDLVIDELRVSSIEPNDVLIRTAFAGLCHSDLHFMQGVHTYPLPVVLGHEGAGIVEAVGPDVRSVSPGDHVVVCVSMFCGECRHCLMGRPYLCPNRAAVRERQGATLRREDGSPVEAFGGLGTFAEEMLVHERGVVRIRSDMPMDVAALIGCSVTTGLGAVMRTAQVEPASSIAVVGCGGVGLSAIQGGRLVNGFPIVAVDLSDEKLRIAQRLGATHTVNAGSGDAVEAVREITSGGANYVIEAVGTNGTVEQSIAMAGRGATVVIVGMPPPGQAFAFDGLGFLSRELVLRGSMMGANRFKIDIPWYTDLYMSGRLALDELVTARIDLVDVNDGYSNMAAGIGARSVIDFHLGSAVDES